MELRIGNSPCRKGRINGGFKRSSRMEENIMSIFLASDSPDLFNWVQIRRIWRQHNKFHTITDICKFFLLFSNNQSVHFLMPGSIIHYNRIFLSLWYRRKFQEGSEGFDWGFIVELWRTIRKKDTRFWIYKSTVGNVAPSRKRLYFWFTSFFVPLCCKCCLLLKMHLILINEDSVIIIQGYISSFLNSSLASVSSYSLLGNTCGLILEYPNSWNSLWHWRILRLIWDSFLIRSERLGPSHTL